MCLETADTAPGLIPEQLLVCGPAFRKFCRDSEADLYSEPGVFLHADFVVVFFRVYFVFILFCLCFISLVLN